VCTCACGLDAELSPCGGLNATKMARQLFHGQPLQIQLIHFYSKDPTRFLQSSSEQ